MAGAARCATSSRADTPAPARCAPGGQQVRAPRRPVVAAPAFADAREVAVRDVDVRELDAAAGAILVEGEDQCRVELARAELGRAPGLHDQPARHDLQDAPRERTVERLEGR